MVKKIVKESRYLQEGTACDRSRQAGCDRFDRYVKSK